MKNLQGIIPSSAPSFSSYHEVNYLKPALNIKHIVIADFSKYSFHLKIFSPVPISYAEFTPSLANSLNYLIYCSQFECWLVLAIDDDGVLINEYSGCVDDEEVLEVYGYQSSDYINKRGNS